MSSSKVFRTEGEALPEIAAILAKGVLAHLQRFKRSQPLPIVKKADESSSPLRIRPRRVIRRAVSESGPNRLEVPSETRPSVCAG